MVTLHIILRHYAVVLYPGLVEKVGGVGLLEQGVSDVLFIPEDLVDGRGVPCGLAGSGGNAVPFKSRLDPVHAVSFQVFPVDALYDFSLLRINDEIAFRILGVAKKAVVVNLHLSLLVAVLKTKLDVLGQRLGFLLRQRGHYGQEHLALGIKCVDRLLLEVDRNVLRFERSYMLETVQGVSGKTADGLGDNHVDSAGSAVVYHAVELDAVFGIGAGNAVIGIDDCQCPFRISADVFGVVLHLGFVAGGLFLGISGYAAVCYNPEPWFLFN